MPGGRPTDYTQEIADLICFRIGEGNSLRKVLREDQEGDHIFPCGQTIYSWFRIYPDFLEQYARAKEESGDADQDKLDEIAEKVLTGEYEPQQARVAADIIKWSASKKKPKKYGDRITTEHTGTVGIADMSEDQLNAAIEKFNRSNDQNDE